MQHSRSQYFSVVDVRCVAQDVYTFDTAYRTLREFCGEAMGTPGHLQKFVAIGLPYAKVELREKLCALVRYGKPTVDRRQQVPDGIIAFGLAG